VGSERSEHFIPPVEKKMPDIEPGIF
jgi:hypothetical protein